MSVDVSHDHPSITGSAKAHAGDPSDEERWNKKEFGTWENRRHHHRHTTRSDLI